MNFARLTRRAQANSRIHPPGSSPPAGQALGQTHRQALERGNASQQSNQQTAQDQQKLDCAQLLRYAAAQFDNLADLPQNRHSVGTGLAAGTVRTINNQQEERTMEFWKGTMDTFYYEKEADKGQSCEVRMTDDEIVLSYEEDSTKFQYQGKAVAPGHFQLESSPPLGKATLHRMPGENFLVGYWTEARRVGVWRVDLDELVRKD